MLYDLVKVTHSRGQTRITIPKIIAKETGLDQAYMVGIEQSEDNSIIIKEWDGRKDKKRDIQKDKT